MVGRDAFHATTNAFRVCDLALFLGGQFLLFLRLLDKLVRIVRQTEVVAIMLEY